LASCGPSHRQFFIDWGSVIQFTIFFGVLRPFADLTFVDKMRFHRSAEILRRAVHLF
jgi:hypothetical protein